MEDPFPSFWDHYSSSGCTLAEMLDYADEKSNSLGFMELLNMHDSAAFQEEEEHPNQNSKLQESLNAPQTPNCSSISSESSDRGLINKEEEDGDEEEDDNDQKKKTSKQLKAKKTNQKKKREQRFAFMTKSEVDHLEDGYRWRKYGQKAVKNSPFPRSYYRCTNPTCNVKKRVERSCTDPTIVVTTYEGQHTHPIPQSQRHHAPPPHPGFSTTQPNIHHQLINYSLLANGYMGGGGGAAKQLSFCSQPPALMANNGLLQDIVPWPAAKREEEEEEEQ
ncbi:WRKY transcription factor 23-like [Salvia splendens]|uniref:WRKY transcription factor 23-like n=1 Tax=Salvia splendens TaxID=180675 RepID=UPI001C2669B3|nr:WRKY transcription factor 23-like [Salvia splendens]